MKKLMYMKGIYQMQYAYINPKIGNAITLTNRKYNKNVSENLPDGL
ncbi:hypothetical protein [Flavobacterium sp.]|nr:hypothetical protein [Flavobacterium sp.]